jgi:hypothetical protein
VRTAMGAPAIRAAVDATLSAAAAVGARPCRRNKHRKRWCSTIVCTVAQSVTKESRTFSCPWITLVVWQPHYPVAIPDWTSSCIDGGSESYVNPLRAAQQIAGRPLRFTDSLDAPHSGHELAKYRMGLHSRELCPQA